ncbi:hypothetical protein AB0G15_03015 [Streptosporangium sp. NPDC023825]|uniref:hypothetical protein n=1 Tax=Streptosporangium sp. NPDC023825 TaxID=3154909 RepID=UPI00342CCED0
MRHRIDRMVADIDPGPGPGLTAGALELLDELTATPREPATVTRRLSRGPLRPRTAALLVTGSAAAVVMVGGLLPGGLGVTPSQADALDIERRGAFYVVTVKDLFADPKLYEAQLRERGLDIRMRVEPVPPAVEGGIFTWDTRMDGRSMEEIERSEEYVSAIRKPGACAVQWQCPIGLKVPVDFTGSATVTLGRKANQGERYTVLRPLQEVGEPLHCVPFLGRSVDLVRGLLRERGVTVGTYFDGKGSRSSVPGTWYVQEGHMSEAGKATLFVTPIPKRPEVPGPGMAGDPCPRPS